MILTRFCIIKNALGYIHTIKLKYNVVQDGRLQHLYTFNFRHHLFYINVIIVW
jgi:hypothetical protein